jgi:hypothetical protein
MRFSETALFYIRSGSSLGLKCIFARSFEIGNDPGIYIGMDDGYPSWVMHYSVLFVCVIIVGLFDCRLRLNCTYCCVRSKVVLSNQ